MSCWSHRLRTQALRCALSCGCLCLALASAALAQSSSSYFQAVDGNADGRISLVEFLERMSWAFQQMDRNDDQVLEPHEQLVPNAPTLSLAALHQRLEKQFRRQDRNHDGWLSAAEFLAPPA